MKHILSCYRLNVYCYEVILYKTFKNGLFYIYDIFSPSLSDFSYQCDLDKEWRILSYI